MAQWLAGLADLPAMLLTASLGLVMFLDGIPVFGLLIPADAAVMVAMAARGPVGSIPVLIGVVGGYLVTATLGFGIGHRYGMRMREGRVGAWIGEARWTTGEQVITAGGCRMLIAAPFLPFVSTVVPLIAGVLRVPYRRFILSLTVGSTAWTGLYIAIGVLADVVGKAMPGGSTATMASIAVGLLLSLMIIRSVCRVTRTALAAPVAVQLG